MNDDIYDPRRELAVTALQRLAETVQTTEVWREAMPQYGRSGLLAAIDTALDLLKSQAADQPVLTGAPDAQPVLTGTGD